MAKLKGVQGFPWHVDRYHIHEDDEVRSRGLCVYYSESNHCDLNCTVCYGASHCKYYSTNEADYKKLLERRKKNLKSFGSKEVSSDKNKKNIANAYALSTDILVDPRIGSSSKEHPKLTKRIITLCRLPSDTVLCPYDHTALRRNERNFHLSGELVKFRTYYCNTCMRHFVPASTEIPRFDDVSIVLNYVKKSVIPDALPENPMVIPCQNQGKTNTPKLSKKKVFECAKKAIQSNDSNLAYTDNKNIEAYNQFDLQSAIGMCVLLSNGIHGKVIGEIVDNDLLYIIVRTTEGRLMRFKKTEGLIAGAFQLFKSEAEMSKMIKK